MLSHNLSHDVEFFQNQPGGKTKKKRRGNDVLKKIRDLYEGKRKQFDLKHVSHKKGAKRWIIQQNLLNEES